MNKKLKTILKKMPTVIFFLTALPAAAFEESTCIDTNKNGINETVISSPYDEYLYINSSNGESIKASNFVIDGYSYFDSVIESENGFNIITKGSDFDAVMSIAIEYTDGQYYVSSTDSKSSYMEQNAIKVNIHCVTNINERYLNLDTSKLAPFLLNYEDKYFNDFCTQTLSSPYPITWFEKKIKERKIAINKTFIELLLNVYPISMSNVAYYNNIGYYLEKMEKYQLASKVLNEVINNSPDRIVAYLNIGDVYQGLGEKIKVKEYYQHYFNKMSDMGKESKIPSRVIATLNKHEIQL